MVRRVVAEAGHGFDVEADSPLGIALNETNRRNGRYVTLSAVPQFVDSKASGPFQYLDLSEPCLHPLLNCGKEWVR